MDFERLDVIARQIMLHRRSHIEREIGHVYYHGARTMVGVIELRRLITMRRTTIFCARRRFSTTAARQSNRTTGAAPHWWANS